MISFLTILIPTLGQIAGLSLGITIPLFLVACLFSVKERIKISFSNFKLELAFFFLLAISAIWSINALTTLTSLFKIFSLCLVTYILITNKEILCNKVSIKTKTLSFALIGSLLLFYAEYYSHGAISTLFNNSLLGRENYSFRLSDLDRGCTLLSLFTWVLIARLIQGSKCLIASAVYFLILGTLAISDSLSSFLGFGISGIVFFLTRYTFLKNPKFLSFLLVIAAIFFVYLASILEPREASAKLDFLPGSAKHRLFIWDFTTDKIAEKPIFGWGHASSKKIKVDADLVQEYQGREMHPFPLHPHNNLLQILLENGVIGFAIYLALICKYLTKWNNSCMELNHKSAALRAAGYAAFSTFFVVSMISFSMWQSWWVCCFLWIAIMLTTQIQPEKTTQA